MSDDSVITRAINALSPQIAVIREAECIGCTKCIQACPVDAIIGASKHMHTIIADVCIGCGLCVPPCPVDCIDLTPTTRKEAWHQQQFADQARQRAEQHRLRLAHQTQQQQDNHQQQNFQQETLSARQAAIQAAVLRTKAKKKAYV